MCGYARKSRLGEVSQLTSRRPADWHESRLKVLSLAHPGSVASTTPTHWCRSRVGSSTVLCATTTTSATTSSSKRVSSSNSSTTSTGENDQHRMVRIDLDIVPMTTLHKVAIWTPSTEDNIDAMVFESTIGQSVLPPELISNTITYILNLRHREVELRSIFLDQLETVIDQAQRQSAFGIAVHLAEHLFVSNSRWSSIGSRHGVEQLASTSSCICSLKPHQHLLRNRDRWYQSRSCMI